MIGNILNKGSRRSFKFLNFGFFNYFVSRHYVDVCGPGEDGQRGQIIQVELEKYPGSVG